MSTQIIIDTDGLGPLQCCRASVRRSLIYFVELTLTSVFFLEEVHWSLRKRPLTRIWHCTESSRDVEIGTVALVSATIKARLPGHTKAVGMCISTITQW